ncbi:MAG: hypothetical protein CVV48_15635 [Spirochaetae bacterium HGW-Spirochaetae-4]|nr:MAG: hypothetical protein A2Y31_04640 [Spirochaetes bacterium GWC2_52_13]PKL19904.1 MAG: hypothetical protein CVV48_15635 [Spirochaetae bacterium HGW-Spirochaetae-4]HCG64694.1 hypothetical protein [Sphaerochaeta sp.]HCS37508.1 hypothetical protein [Sphaerochaeta sp.]
MKRVVLAVCLIVAGIGLISAAASTGLYTLVIPEQFSTMEVQGGVGGVPGADVVRLELDTDPSDARFNIGADADYQWYRRTEDTTLNIDASGTLSFGNSLLSFDFDVDPSYKSYTLDLGSMKGFFTVGASFGLWGFVPFPGTSEIELDVFPYGEAGVGRLYSIYTLKRIETIMKYLGVTPTEENIRKVAQIMYQENQRLLEFNDDFSRNYFNYFSDIAAAMGIPDKVLDLAVLGNSQRYKFEMARYVGLQHGWEAAIRLTPGVSYDKGFSTTTTDFRGSLYLYGEYGGFLIEDMLHLGADAGVRLAYETDHTDKFYAILGASGTVRYLPDNYRLWAEGIVNINYSTSTLLANPFDLDIRAQLNYMINPNFTTYGGVSILNTFKNLAVYAGGSIRIW